MLTFSPAAGMNSTQRPSFDKENISILRTQCNNYEGTILPQQKKSKILGYKYTLFRPMVPILFASRSTFQERNSSQSTIIALLPKARMCIFGFFLPNSVFKSLVFYHIARARIIF